MTHCWHRGQGARVVHEVNLMEPTEAAVDFADPKMRDDRDDEFDLNAAN
jgi:hypothetical protein